MLLRRSEKCVLYSDESKTNFPTLFTARDFQIYIIFFNIHIGMFSVFQVKFTFKEWLDIGNMQIYAACMLVLWWLAHSM